MIKINRGEAYDGSRNYVVDSNGAHEYAWYGWNKWEGHKDEWNIIGRLTWSEKHTNLDWWNDRILTVWAGAGWLQFSTNHFRPGGPDVFSQYFLTNNIGWGNVYYNWFFLYIGYSYTEKRATAYLKFADGFELDVPFPRDMTQGLCDRMVFMQGKDKYFTAFNGYMNGYRVEYGPGAFRSGIPSYRQLMYKTNPQSV